MSTKQNDRFSFWQDELVHEECDSFVVVIQRIRQLVLIVIPIASVGVTSTGLKIYYIKLARIF